MKRAKRTLLAREELDQLALKWKPVAKWPRPKPGWIREIREALGMPAWYLAKKLGVSQQSIAALERAEAAGRANMATLARAAKALDCHFICALVPKKPLRQMLRDRAFGIVMPEVLVSLRRSRLDLPDQTVIQMSNNLIRRRGMLDRPRELWKEHKLPKEFEQALEVTPAQPRQPVPQLSPEQEAALEKFYAHVRAKMEREKKEGKKEG